MEAQRNATPSLSKGVFLHKKPVSKKKLLSESADNLIPENWIFTKESFSTVWASLEKEIETIQSSCYNSIVQDVVSFVQTSSTRDSFASTILNAIPTAALIMGVNMPDHSAVFTLLEKCLHNTVTPYVARVQSKDCLSLAHMIQKIVYAITEKETLPEDVFQLKKHNCTFEMLNKWYTLAVHEKECPTPSKRFKGALQNVNPIVIMVEDMESFKGAVLQDFILICSNYLQQLPLILVLGVATAMVAVHNLLPQRVTSCLAIETFTSSPATEYLGQVFEKVIMNPSIPFKLGPKVFQTIVDMTLFHDFSLSNLRHVLKFTILEHFCSKKSSILCFVNKTLKNVVRNLDADVIEEIKELPSVKDFFGKLQAEDQKILVNRKKFCNEILRMSGELQMYQQNQHVLLQCLYCIVSEIPSFPLGKQMRELYVHVLALDKPINESSEYQKTFKLLSMLSREGLESRLRKCIRVLEDSAQSKEVTIDDWRKKMDNFLSAVTEINSEHDVNVEDKEIVTPISFNKRVSRAELKEKLKDLASKKKKSSKFEVWRQDVVSFWDEMFRNLKSPLSFPLHEAFYFTDAALLKCHILAAPKARIHTALSDPQFCFQCKCCKLDSLEDIKATMPPIAIIYKLHLECGNLINIYDWLQAYQAVKSTKVHKKSHSDEMVCQAEFFQAVSELQLLGIIKPTKRKTDHISRLTWGHC